MNVLRPISLNCEKITNILVETDNFAQSNHKSDSWTHFFADPAQSDLESDRTGDDSPRHSQESEVNRQPRPQEDITRHIRLSLPRKSRCFLCFLLHFGRKLYYTFIFNP